jgi:hypothetical protein
MTPFFNLATIIESLIIALLVLDRNGTKHSLSLQYLRAYTADSASLLELLPRHRRPRPVAQQLLL